MATGSVPEVGRVNAQAARAPAGPGLRRRAATGRRDRRVVRFAGERHPVHHCPVVSLPSGARSRSSPARRGCCSADCAACWKLCASTPRGSS